MMDNRFEIFLKVIGKSLQLTVSVGELLAITIRQLNAYWPMSEREKAVIETLLSVVLERLGKCLFARRKKDPSQNGSAVYSPFHSDQHCLFLYWLSRCAFEAGEIRLAEKSYYLNKVMHSVDLFYEIEMPDHFSLEHPLGSVIGRGIIGDYFCCLQGCTIGNNKGMYPTLENHVMMLQRSSVIGDSRIGHHSIISAGTYVKDTDIPSYSLVFGGSPNLTIKKITVDYYTRISLFVNDII